MVNRKKPRKRPLGLYLLLFCSLLVIAGLWLASAQKSASPGMAPESPAAPVKAKTQPKTAPDSRPPPPKQEVPAAPAANSARSAPLLKPMIALIIDDIGYQLESGRRSIDLPGAVTLALLPFSPHARRLADLAVARGKELMLHAPMEPGPSVRWEGGLSNGMDRSAIHHALAQMLDSLPQVKGVNNHMGSALTENRQTMDWVMEALEERNLYFIDSRTSALSQAFPAALSRSMPSAKRDVFLDHDRSSEAIARQFESLLEKARKNGFAIGIGHPYPETLAYLEQALPELDRYGVRLVPVSHLLTQVSDTSKPWAKWLAARKGAPNG